MTNLLICGSLSAALFASGCATTGTSTSSGLTLQEFIADAQIAAEGVCAIAPTAEAITSIFTAANAATALTAAGASAAANLFCTSITKLSARKLGGALVQGPGGIVDYGSVVIRGTRVELTGTPLR